MELSTTQEATGCAATLESPSSLCDLIVHYRIHNGSSLVPILSQINPANPPILSLQDPS
jgi:hypothetical protein